MLAIALMLATGSNPEQTARMPSLTASAHAVEATFEMAKVDLVLLLAAPPPLRLTATERLQTLTFASAGFVYRSARRGPGAGERGGG